MNREHWILAAVACVSYITNADTTAVNLVLTLLAKDIGIPLASTQSILTSYILVFAAFCALGGKWGDRYGQRNVLLIGLAIFTAGSIITASSQTLWSILLGRVVQGFGATLISPNAMSLAFTLNEKKGLVSGIITSAVSAGIASGPLLGGFLAQIYSWRLIFLVNLPLCLFASMILLITIKSHDRTRKTVQIDYLGAALLSLMLFFLVAALSEFSHIHATSLLLLMSGFILATIGFVRWERKAQAPLIPIPLLTNVVVVYSCVLRFLFAMPLMMLAFLSALFLQTAYQLNAIDAGLLFLPFTLAMMLVSPFAGQHIDQKGYIIPLFIGAAISILAYLGIAYVSYHQSIFLFASFFALAGIGTAYTRSALSAAIAFSTPEKELGLVSSLFNMMNSIGSAIGIVVASLILGLFVRFDSPHGLTCALPMTMYFSIVIFIFIIFLTAKGLRDH